MSKIEELKQKQLGEMEALNKEIAIMEDIAKYTSVEPDYVSVGWKKSHIVFKVKEKMELKDIMLSLEAIPIHYFQCGASHIYSTDELEKAHGSTTIKDTSGEEHSLIEYNRKKGKLIDLTSPYYIYIGNSRHTGDDYKVMFKTKDYDISVYITKDMIEDYVTTGVYKDPHATDEASKWDHYKEIKQHCYTLSLGLKEIHYYGNSFQYIATNDDQLDLMNEILGT